MQRRKDRVIIDSNIWISFLLTSDLSKFDNILVDDSLVIILSQQLIDEFIEVTQRNKFKRYFDLQDVKSLLVKIRERSIIIDVTSDISVCRDPKDDFLLSLAKDGNASHLITGDKDLLVLKRFEKTKILTIAEYLSGK